MAPAKRALLVFFFSLVSAFPNLSSEVEEDRKVGNRALLGFKEKSNGGNITFDCSPSGPCVPCAYSEKTRENYRCSETGYRIPLKCVEAKSRSVEAVDNNHKVPKDRSNLENVVSEAKTEANEYHPSKETSPSITKRGLRDDPPTEKNARQPYITYRSCIPALNEEKLSVLGFEVIMFGLLLISGSAIYFRRKKTNVLPSGHVRIPDNSRF